MGRETSGVSTVSNGMSRALNVGDHTSNEAKRLLRRAGNLLVRSREIEHRIADIEMASQACKCARIVADTIADVLEKARNILTEMRQMPDPNGRFLLAKSFNNILKQIDSIVTEGYYDIKNLAKNENIVISTDATGSHKFSISGIDMSSAGLDLQPLESELISNADIIERLTKVDAAANNMVAHSCSYDTIASLLKSRMDFARGLIDVLEEGHNQISNSRAGNEALTHAIAEITSTVSIEKETVSDTGRSRMGRYNS